MFINQLFSGVRAKLGTSVSDRYTDTALLATIEEVIHHEIFANHPLSCFVFPEKTLPVSGNQAVLPSDYFLMAIDESSSLQKVDVNAMDEATKNGKKAYAIRRRDDGQEVIVLNFEIPSIVIRYIPYINLVSGNEIFPLPLLFKSTVEFLTAGRILQNDQQQSGETVWQEGLTHLANAVAQQKKQDTGTDGFSVSNSLDEKPFWNY